jgi:peptide/nickel transport system permease protein
MALAKYIGRKVAWTLVVFFVALLLNFLLPRLIPGNPVERHRRRARPGWWHRR